MASYRPTFTCDPCEVANGDTITKGVGFCAQCKEMYCLQCLKAHMVMGMTRDHPVVVFEPVGFETAESYCHICFSLGEGKKPAITVCIDCRELYCDPCKQRHVRFGATKNHDLQDIVTNAARGIADDSVNLSSDFEKFIISADKELSMSESIRNQQKLSKSVLLSTSKNQHNIRVALSDNKTKETQAPVQQVRNSDEIDIDKISITKVTTVNCKADGDSTSCYFVGIVCMKDGRTVLLDYDNKKLKLLDHNLRILSTEPIKLKEGWTCRMIKISEQQIAVYNGKNVSFCNIKDNRLFLHKSGSVEVYGEPIPYTSDKYATRINNQIKVYSTTGHELQSIDIGDRLNFRFELDLEGDRFYAVYGGLFECCSLQAELLWKIRDTNGPVYVAQRSNCLFIGCFVGAVILCNKDGTCQRKIIEDLNTLYAVTAIAYNAVTGQLLLSRLPGTKHGDEIVVLQLSL